MLLRPNWNKSSTLTVTQFVHEWAHALEKKGGKIADAGRGRPSFPADIDAVNAMFSYAEKLKNSRDVALYGTSVLGEKKYREQVARGFLNEYGIEFPTYEIMFTPGGQFAIAATANLISSLNNGYILTPKPWYVNHDAIMSIYSKLHAIDLPAGGKITAESLSASLKTCPQPGAFLFCNPGNPLGNIMRKRDWLLLAPILEAHDIPIILDEAFTEVIFDGDYQISLLHALPHLADRVIILRSGTKALGLPGERLSVIRAPQKYMEELEEFQSRLIGNCPLSVQAGMAAAMEKMGTPKKAAISEYYKNNADYMVGEFDKLGLIHGHKPEGGFYFIADFSFMLGHPMPEEARNAYSIPKETIEDDIDVTMALMFGFGQQPGYGVGTVPASCFGFEAKKGCVRISFSSERANLEAVVEGVKQVRKFSS